MIYTFVTQLYVVSYNFHSKVYPYTSKCMVIIIIIIIIIMIIIMIIITVIILIVIIIIMIIIILIIITDNNNNNNNNNNDNNNYNNDNDNSTTNNNNKKKKKKKKKKKEKKNSNDTNKNNKIRIVISLYNRRYCFYFIICICMPALILHRDLWPTVGQSVHTTATRDVHISNYPLSIPQCHLSTRDDI